MSVLSAFLLILVAYIPVDLLNNKNSPLLDSAGFAADDLALNMSV